MSEDDEHERPTPVKRSDLTRAGDVELGMSGVSTWRERGRMRAHERFAQAQNAVVRAKENLNTAIADYLRSQQKVHEEFERNQSWHANIEVVRRRIQDEYDAEDHEREIKRRERQVELAEAELRAAEAQAKLEATKDRLEAEKQRRAEKGKGQQSSRPTRKEIVRQEIEQIIETGTLGTYMAIAEEYRQKLIAKRGGEEHLTEKDKENIELAFEHARRQQESKG